MRKCNSLNAPDRSVRDSRCYRRNLIRGCCVTPDPDLGSEYRLFVGQKEVSKPADPGGPALNVFEADAGGTNSVALDEVAVLTDVLVFSQFHPGPTVRDTAHDYAPNLTRSNTTKQKRSLA